MDFKHYDVWYYAKARLIDGRTGSVIRQAKCARKPEKTANSPTIDELLADDGAKLRAAVEAAKLPHGGVDYIAALLGCDPKTIRQGRADLKDLPPVPPERCRKKGADEKT